MKKRIFGIILIIMGFFGILFLEKYYIERPFSIDRFLLFMMVDIFIGLHFILDYKKLWNFIYKKRYLIGIVLFIYVVMMGYNGSSINAYNGIIEPSIPVENSTPILGNYRAIRSDEYLVDTPSILSQYEHNKDLSTVNDALMARDTTVYMFPQLPTKNISILTNPRLLGFLFLDLNQAYSFYWYFPYFALFFGLFELLMILTKKNKLLSLLGTVMLEFSPSLQWWNSPAFLLYGSYATIFFYHLFHTDDKIKKCLYSILLGWMGSCYIMILYPAWQITYGYLFLGLFIYVLIDQKNKIKWTDFLYLILSIFTILVLVLPAFLNSLGTINSIMSTEYPGARMSTGGSGWQLYYNYFSSIFFSIFNIENPCESGQFISFYPIPILIGIIIIFKSWNKKEKNILLFILTIIAIFLSIWNYIGIGILSKLALLSMSTPDRAQLTVGVICIFILIVWMNDYNASRRNLKWYIISIVISIVFTGLGLCISNGLNPEYMNMKMKIICYISFVTLIFLLLLNTKFGNFIFSVIMILFGLFLFATIHPINKGLSVIRDKPLALEVQKISKENPDAVWISLNAPIHLQSYLLANGARVLNSTNYYPNLELWKKFDPDMKNNEVYNRYAHIVLDITTESTFFELIQDDLFRLYINPKDICKLDIDYIATTTSLEEYELNINKIYGLENILIYQIDCPCISQVKVDKK